MSLPPTVTSGSEPPVMQASSSTVASTAAMLPSSTPGSAILAGPSNVDCSAIWTIRLLHPSSTPGGVTPPPPPSFPPATSPFVLTTTTVPLLTASGSASLPPLPSASFLSVFPPHNLSSPFHRLFLPGILFFPLVLTQVTSQYSGKIQEPSHFCSLL